MPTINWEELFQFGQGLEPEFINRLKQIVAASSGVTSVSAGDGTISVGGTASDPTISVNAITEAKVTGLVADLAAKQPLDADLTAIAALTTTPLGRSLLEAATAAAIRTIAGLGTAAVAATTDFDAAGAAAAAAAASQPLDADLTAIAAVATANYGRSLLALANVAALYTALSVDTDGTLAANSDTKIPSQKAVKTYADALLSAAQALKYKGVIDCSANPNYPAAAIGDVYVISVAGKIGGASGTTVDVTDMVICTIANAGGTQAAVGADFAIVQANLIGAVTGPASATDGNLAVFNGATGKIIKDGGAILKRKLLAMWCGTVVPASGTTNGIAEVQKDSDGSTFAFVAARAVARLETVSTSDQTFVIQVAAGGDIAFGTPTTVATITVTAGHFRAEVTGLSQAINSGDLLALLVSAGGAQVPYSVELIATT